MYGPRIREPLEHGRELLVRRVHPLELDDPVEVLLLLADLLALHAVEFFAGGLGDAVNDKIFFKDDGSNARDPPPPEWAIVTLRFVTTNRKRPQYFLED